MTIIEYETVVLKFRYINHFCMDFNATNTRRSQNCMIKCNMFVVSIVIKIFVKNEHLAGIFLERVRDAGV